MYIIIADDHTLFREAMCHYIERSDPQSKIDQVADIHGVITLLEQGEKPDIILLDLHMPGMSGLNAVRRIRKEWPDTAIALLSGLAEEEDIHEALSIGVRGYFPKTLPGKAMLQGLKKILEQEIFTPLDYNTSHFMPSHYGDMLMKNLPASTSAEINLTPREKEVLEFLLKGTQNKEIAIALGLEVVTIKLHIRGICRKLGAKNRTQAALLAQKMGLGKHQGISA